MNSAVLQSFSLSWKQLKGRGSSRCGRVSQNTIIFMEGKESSTVFLLKRIVEGILKQLPDEQRLYKDHRFLDNGKILGECGFTSQTQPRVGLALQAGEAFETLPIKPFSSPPELPEVMKPQDPGSIANEQAEQ
ncbi:elongin-B-like [Mesoplodon densirostris]|uniref:elongin-B-like n=1 Tax=Mesoplodon densirostris TaxID=48708 RepID=UPI0028DBEE7E|nr:elongin-B-like [Mesoplodon densirostris]